MATSTIVAGVAPFAALERARGLAKGGLRAVLAWQVGRTALRLGFAAATAILVGRLVMGAPVDEWQVAAVPALLLLAGLAGLMADRVQAKAETAISTSLREAARQRLSAMPAGQARSLPVGGLVVSMQRHPEAVGALVVGHRAATLMMAIGPLMAAAMLFAVSWQAALLVLALTPLMLVFFVLVGETIRKRAQEQERSFGQLAGQFEDRIRTLPTILANHGLAAEEAKLAGRLGAYADRTMGVLRVAFLNAAIIDFFASLSIAMLAVFLGLGHLKLAMIPGFSDLQLWQSLFILMIAPEYFAPLRRFSEQYHAKAEGLAAAQALDGLMRADAPTEPEIAVFDRFKLRLPVRGLVAVTGPSGAGKSTLLRRLAGLDPRHPGDRELEAARIAWIAADSHVRGETLAAAIAPKGISVPEGRLRAAAGLVGLLDDVLLPGGLAAPIGPGGGNLSGGQRLRLALARSMLTDRAIVADEPTAKLDAETAGKVRLVLREMAKARLVVVATHDPALTELADRVIALTARSESEAA